FDFSTTITGKINSKNELINASVLGLIFEKINGYADGSFFTPGKITMYMSRKAIRSTAVDKINLAFGWKAKNIQDIKNYVNEIESIGERTARRLEISNVIDTMKICDPAVGSGHFLVSVLNEIVALKSELRVLFDEDNHPLEINAYVTNDELIIQDGYGDNFYYNRGNVNSLKIQKALFIQKQSIIENCLFGVDINPNSVNICRLRLWIELLKNSYYAESGELVTLPNIDINIKIGDSLLHKFDFDFSFDMRKNDFKEYLSLVKEYKNTNNKHTKSEIFEKITKIKSSFDDTATSPELRRLKKLQKELSVAGLVDLFGDEKEEQKRFDEISKELSKAQKDFDKAMQNPMFANGLEWRMEFPEILSEDGEFEGFDLVIGNPPYIFARNQSFSEDMKKYFSETYDVSEYQANTYTLFIELAYKLMRKGGTFSYIIPNNFLTIQTNSKMRKFITDETSDVVLINSLDKIFTDASVDNCILFFKKNAPNWIEALELKAGEFNPVGRVESNFFGDNPVFSISMIKFKAAINAFWKVNSFPILNRPEIATVTTGIKAYQIGKGKPKQKKYDKENRVYHSKNQIDETYVKYLEGKNVSRYNLTWNGEWIKYGDNLAEPRYSIKFDSPRILVRQIPTNKSYAIEAVYTDSHLINDINSMDIINIQVDPLYVLGIINSKLLTLWFMMKYDKFQRRIFPQFKVNELGNFPTPTACNEQQEDISKLVQLLMDQIKKEKKDETKILMLNNQIDELVMQLFGLTEDEKRSVRDFEV
ncbi:N-6 DNA methylase, partial [Enterococcus faecalis]|uniref:Eco57I restriction-modification methylase domain-containing protein n=2 Tax=Enterococcus TaxID=1350 RepID=UPI001143C7CF